MAALMLTFCFSVREMHIEWFSLDNVDTYQPFDCQRVLLYHKAVVFAALPMSLPHDDQSQGISQPYCIWF